MKVKTFCLFLISLFFTQPITPVFSGEDSPSNYERIIEFSGYKWKVKVKDGLAGPGPNYFSDSEENVWVDGDGNLHLNIIKRNGKWQCSEVILQENLGYGSYLFQLKKSELALDPNVVAGFFTWDTDPKYDNREIDIEFTKWSEARGDNIWYNVRPVQKWDNYDHFKIIPGKGMTTHGFLWEEKKVTFYSLSGTRDSFDNAPSDSILRKWEYQGTDIKVPPKGKENYRINFWLYKGRAPTNNQKSEIIIDKFIFLPK